MASIQRFRPLRVSKSLSSLQLPVFEFLAPSVSALHYRRAFSTATSRRQADAETASSTTGKKPAPPLTEEQVAYLHRALRVNQAGELAATLIYAAQTPPVVRAHPHLRPLMAHMHAQEAGHLATFNALLARHRVRPTALTPVWRAAASGLGWATGLAGREAAMACTEAVETEIGEHYNAQVRELLAWVAEREERGEEVGEELSALVETIRRIRDEELEHLDHAVEEDAKEAKGYPILSGVVRAGCRGAIWLSERV